MLHLHVLHCCLFGSGSVFTHIAGKPNTLMLGLLVEIKSTGKVALKVAQTTKELQASMFGSHVVCKVEFIPCVIFAQLAIVSFPIMYVFFVTPQGLSFSVNLVTFFTRMALL